MERTFKETKGMKRMKRELGNLRIRARDVFILKNKNFLFL